MSLEMCHSLALVTYNTNFRFSSTLFVILAKLTVPVNHLKDPLSLTQFYDYFYIVITIIIQVVTLK